MKKSGKKLLKAMTVDLSGGTSTAAQQLSDINAQLRQASGQTFALHHRVLSAFLAKKDQAVALAKAALAGADDEFSIARHRAALKDAQQSRLIAKMVIADNARQHGALPHGRFGPNSTDLFNGTSNTLPDDNKISYR